MGFGLEVDRIRQSKDWLQGGRVLALKGRDTIAQAEAAA